MFAYCGNAPSNHSDPTGHAAGWTNVVAINDGFPRGNGPSIMKSDPYIPEEYANSNYLHIKKAINTAESSIAAIMNTIKKQSIQLVNYVQDNKYIQTLLTTNKIRANLKRIREGFLLLSTPVPTLADELIGFLQITWGYFSIVVCIGD